MGTDWEPRSARSLAVLVQSTKFFLTSEWIKSLENSPSEKSFEASRALWMYRVLAGPPRNTRSSSIRKSSSPHGLSIGQVERAACQQQHQRGRQLHRRRRASRSTCSRWHSTSSVQDIENTVVKTANGTAIRIKDIATVVARAEDSVGTNRQGHSSATTADRRQSGHGGRHCAAAERRRLRSGPAGIHDEVKQTKTGFCPRACKIVPFLDRSDLVKFTVDDRGAQPDRGHDSGFDHSLSFLGNVRGAIIVALTIPFALLFAAICLT